MQLIAGIFRYYRVVILQVFLLFACACSSSIFIADPIVEVKQSKDFVYLNISRNSIEDIIKADLTPWFYLSDCGNIDKNMVSYVHLNDEILGEIDKAPAGDTFKIYAIFPEGSVDIYKDPCIQIRGVGYMMNTIKSNLVPISRNNSL
jgi:hypothetical protein